MHAPVPPPSDPHLEVLLESLESATALVGADGVIVARNLAWSQFPHGNPLVASCLVGTNYRETCQALVKGNDSNLSIVALGIVSVLNGHVPRLRLDYPCQEEGRVRWYGMNGIRSAGPGLCAVIHHADITERMEREKRLRRSAGLFRITTETALDFISILTTDGNPVFHSPSYEKVLGFPPQALVGPHFMALIHEEDRERFVAALRSGARAGVTQLFEYRMVRQDRTWIHLEGQMVVVENPAGDLDTVLLISRDISQRKEAELERARMEVQLRHSQKMEAVGQLAAGIAHEINTPTQFVGDNLHFLEDAFGTLARITEGGEALARAALEVPVLADPARALLDLAQEENLPYLLQEVPNALAQSLDGVERVSTIVQAMKFFSHPGTEGRVALSLDQAIENTLIVSRNEWKYVATVEKDFDPALPKTVCIPGEFNQMILNLIVNAAQAIEEAQKGGRPGQGVIHLSTRKDGDMAEIRIRDTGMGIPAHLLHQIWVPFFTTKAVGKGTGQGLAIVHSVVAKHGGTVAVESEEGQGSTFIIRIPIEDPWKDGD